MIVTIVTFWAKSKITITRSEKVPLRNLGGEHLIGERPINGIIQRWRFRIIAINIAMGNLYVESDIIVGNTKGILSLKTQSRHPASIWSWGYSSDTQSHYQGQRLSANRMRVL
jgi:hypothetical protein